MLNSESHYRLMQVVDSQKESSDVLRSAYLLDLQNGAMPRNVFERTQQQFFFAVRFFSCAMAALAARIPDSRTRMPLIHNLSDEHGLADAGESARTHSVFEPALAHDQTFLAFLHMLGVGPAEGIPAWRELTAVRGFNLALWASCATEHPSTAFACLGAIEYAFADISASIGNCVVQRGWMNQKELVHYKLHAEIDKRHAAEFLALAAYDWAHDEAGRERVESGLALGFYLFKRLYDDLLTEATNAHGP